MKKLLSIVLVVIVAMGTMVFAFADTGAEEAMVEETVEFQCPYGEEQGQRIMNRYIGSEDGMVCDGEMIQNRLRDGNGAGKGANQGNGLRDGSGIKEGRGQGNGYVGAQDGTGNGDRLRAGTEDCVNAK